MNSVTEGVLIQTLKESREVGAFSLSVKGLIMSCIKKLTTLAFCLLQATSFAQ